MKKIFYLAPLIIIIALLFILFISYKTIIKEETNYPKITQMQFENNAVLDIEVADEESEKKQGLMYRKSLDYNKGMIFIYEQENILNFWMKNTLIPLDIIFLDSNKSIISITKNMNPCKEDPCKIYSSKMPARYAIETNSGYVENNNIQTNQKVKFLN
jgi:uncharacterized protein